MHKGLILFIGILLFLCTQDASADTFSVTVPAGSAVTMGDTQATLPFTVTNNGPTKDIRNITFSINTALYNFSAGTTPPSGWCIKSITSGSIEFALLQGGGGCSSGASASQIAPSQSLAFNIALTGPGGGGFPSAASDVATDTLSGVSVSAEGGFTLSGSLPTWTRKSLAVSISASPSSVGVGGTIQVTMQVANRSGSTQYDIVASPDPPTASSAIVTKTQGPYYGSTLLDGGINSSVTAITVDSTAEFPNSGTIRIDSEEITYTGKTATTFTGCTRGANSTTAASHANNSAVYSLDPFDLPSGESRTITWFYSADASGTVYFTSSARNSGSTATSGSVSSNTVTIGDFTASLTVSPTSVISGQSVTVTMTVSNNGASALINIVPSITPLGTATKTLVSGPTPSSISSLAGGTSGTFQWTYTITGSTGQTYYFSGNATANGPVTSSTGTSNTGSISTYSVVVSPSTVATGSTNVTVSWTVYNNGGQAVKSVKIDIPPPLTSNCSATKGWGYQGNTPPANWGSSTSGAPVSSVTFTSNNPMDTYGIPVGGSKSFSIIFSCVPDVDSDTVYTFPVTITDKNNNTAVVNSTITVTAYSISLSHSPAGPIYADGSSRYTMTATLTQGGSPVSGKTITFATTNGTADPASAVTDSSGQAVIELIAPNSTTDTSAIVTAQYINASATDTVNFTGWTGANLQYWGGLTVSPPSIVRTVNCGSAYSFTMDIRNIGTAGISLTASSYFAFNDSANGGAAVYRAFLDSAVSVSSGTTASLTFGSPTSSGGGGGVSVLSSFKAGTYEPKADSTPPPYSGLYFDDGAGTSDQYRGVTDMVTVAGACISTPRAIRIYRWQEVY